MKKKITLQLDAVRQQKLDILCGSLRMPAHDLVSRMLDDMFASLARAMEQHQQAQPSAPQPESQEPPADVNAQV